MDAIDLVVGENLCYRVRHERRQMYRLHVSGRSKGLSIFLNNMSSYYHTNMLSSIRRSTDFTATSLI